MTKGKALLGVLAGVAAGAALGILFAPDRGENTRKKIAKSGEDLADAVNDRIEKKFNQVLDAIACNGKVKSHEQSESKVS